MKQQLIHTGKLTFVTSLFLILVNSDSSAQMSAKELVKKAKTEIENLPPEKANAELSGGNVVLVDIRETEELTQGKIAGAVHAPRGMLELYTDPTLPYYKPEFNKEKRIILYCTSSGRSALAVQTLKSIGYTNVAHIDGGLKAWKAAGLPVSDK